MDLKAQIKTAASKLGFGLCGVTTAGPPPHADEFQRWIAEGRHGEMGYMARRVERRTDLQNILPGVKSVIVAGMNYLGESETADSPSPGLSREGRGKMWEAVSDGRLSSSSPLAGEDKGEGSRPNTGIIARYARGRDYHEFIGGKLEALSARLRELGGVDVQTKWYVDTGPVLERDLAQRAGIGWIGKHTNLISKQLGNWFFLGEILTTLELEPDVPEREYCGTCTRCITACPTEAIRAPYQLDARRCISYLTIELKDSIPVELRSLIGNRIFGCDDCLAVCPWNRFAKTANTMKLDRADLKNPDLIELMSLTEPQFREHFRGTPIERIRRRGLLRNVAVALGNSGDRHALPVLEKAVTDTEPLVREHAAWAIERIRKSEAL